jgi:hypothetical protein
MNIYIDQKLVKRNSRIGQVFMLGGLVILGVGMYISFRHEELFNLSLIALIAGFLASQVGIYYSNRWGRFPRPYDQLNKALKGLDGRYSLYHYVTPTPHLLVGPAGIWVLMPRNQGGTINFNKGRYRQRGGNLYMKIFAQESLGRPDLEVLGETEKIRNFLKKRMGEEAELPPINAALIFTNLKVNVVPPDGDVDLPAEMIFIEKLKDNIRKTAKAKGSGLPQGKFEEIQAAIAPDDDFLLE